MDVKTQKMLADVITDAQKNAVKPYTTTAKVKGVSNGVVYVEIPGSDRLTPVKNSSVAVKKGDTIDLVVSHEDTHITGNRSDVATSQSATTKLEKVVEANKLQMENKLNVVGNDIRLINNDINVMNSDIEMLASELNVQNSDIETINSSVKIINSAFIIQDGKLTGLSEIITNILSTEYLETDMMNADVAWIEDGKIKRGAIGTVEIADASVTTQKVKDLSADVITTGTLKTECLILTTDEVDPDTGEKKVALITALNAKVQTEGGNLLDGAIVKDGTIEAAKIKVVDLEAFGATIGNFKIGTSSIYNGKKTLTDPTNGVYIGTDGIALGQGGLLGMDDDSPFRVESDGDFHLGAKDNNYVNFDPFTGELDINAKSIKMGSSSVATTANITDAKVDIEADVTEKLKDYATINVTDEKISTAVGVVKTYANDSDAEILKESKSYTDQTTEEISSTVENMDGRLSTVEQKADGFTWGVKVGGRNLCQKTNHGTTNWEWSMGDGTADISEVDEYGVRTCLMTRNNDTRQGHSIICYNNIGRDKWIPNEEYIISVDVKSNVVTIFDVNFYRKSMFANVTDMIDPSKTVVGNNATKVDKWVTLIWKVKALETLPAIDAMAGNSPAPPNVLCLSNMNSDPGVSYQFKNLKLEKGNKATDWTAAPEDIETDIKEASRTASKYMRFDSDGLTISQNAEAEELGKNINITDSMINVRNGNKDLAKYGETIELIQGDKSVFKISLSDFYDKIETEYILIKADSASDESYVTEVNSHHGLIQIDSPINTIDGDSIYAWYIYRLNQYAVFTTNKNLNGVSTIGFDEASQKVVITYESSISGLGTVTSSYDCLLLDNTIRSNVSIVGSLYVNNKTLANNKDLFVNDLTPLIIGDKDKERMEIDCTSISTKKTSLSAAPLYLNPDGGSVTLGLRNQYQAGLSLSKVNMHAQTFFGDHLYFNNNATFFGMKWDSESEGYITRSNFQPLNSNGNCVLGYGNYDAEQGTTYIYGHGINLQTNNYLKSNRSLKVLWTDSTGGLYMGAGHKVTLSEKISNQLNGIVLEWSAYVNNAAQNYWFNQIFIPKEFVKKFPGGGIDMILSGRHLGLKYVYITDNVITGNADNSAATVTASGVTFNPNYFILRNVYGV